MEDAPPPLRKVEFFAKRVTFDLEPDARVDELVRMDLFEGFRPDMTADEAVREVGAPDESGSNNYGPFYVYQRPAGRVVLSFEKHDSWPARSPGRWYLRAYPTQWTMRDAFAAPLQHYLAAAEPGRREVVVMSPDGSAPVIWAILDGEKVEHIKWCPPATGMPGLVPLPAEAGGALPTDSADGNQAEAAAGAAASPSHDLP